MIATCVPKCTWSTSQVGGRGVGVLGVLLGTATAAVASAAVAPAAVANCELSLAAALLRWPVLCSGFAATQLRIHHCGPPPPPTIGCRHNHCCHCLPPSTRAGSERAKRTKAVGQRLQEGININKGLLVGGAG